MSDDLFAGLLDVPPALVPAPEREAHGQRWIEFCRFEVLGTPKAQPRVRAFAQRIGNGYQARVFDPGTAEDWKSQVAIASRTHRPPAPLAGPVRVDVDLFFPRPKAMMRKSDPEGPVAHIAKPDRDNCEKAILDALKILGFFVDDSRVCAGEVRKYYHSKSGRPGAFIIISTLKKG